MTDSMKGPPADGRSTRWDEHKAQRRLAVLEAAIATIEDEGPEVGVTRIAERAGIRRPVLYRHFKDRDDLDSEILAKAVALLVAELRPVLSPTGSAREIIERIIATYLHWIVEHPNLHRFVASRSNSDKAANLRVVSSAKAAISGHAAALFTGYLRQVGVHSQIAEPLAFGLVALVDAAVNRWQARPVEELSAQRLAGYLSAAVWQAIDAALRVDGIELDPDQPLSPISSS